MKTLVHLSRELFTTYSLKTKGRAGKWEYLRKDRQLEWAKEVLIMFEYVYQEFKSTIRPLPLDNVTSIFGRGYLEGQRNERIYFTQVLESVHKDLLDQYEDMRNDGK